MPAVAWLIVDGYSLLHRDPDLAGLINTQLETARQLLVRKVEQILDRLAPRATIVFDGRQQHHHENAIAHHPAIEIRFAPGHLTADTVIERIVHQHPHPATLRIITSDRAERQTVEAAGAETMSCGDFLDLYNRLTRPPPRPKPQNARPRPTLGDFFPDP
jgi:uncharacterized protein